VVRKKAAVTGKRALSRKEEGGEEGRIGGSRYEKAKRNKEEEEGSKRKENWRE
jgi:hypothetical protein